jgi:hypothetical protein
VVGRGDDKRMAGGREVRSGGTVRKRPAVAGTIVALMNLTGSSAVLRQSEVQAPESHCRKVRRRVR